MMQIAMGWEDLHLHQFRVHGKAYGVEGECGITFVDSPHRVTLADFKLRKGEKFVYEYDMGDFWEHDIRLEQTLPLDERKRYPVCIAGGGDCPPEDCGVWRHAAGEIFLIRARAFAFPLASYFVSSRDRMAEL